MAWTTPTIRSTGDLITASIWNTDIVDNLAYLKGEAGVDITLEDDVVPSAGSEKMGKSTAPWDEGHFDKLFAGPRYSLHRFVRNQSFKFEDDIMVSYQMDQITAGGGDIDAGGSGQLRLKVDDDIAGSAYIANQTEQNNAKDTSFNCGRSPYIKIEFCLDHSDSATEVFIGYRTTKGAAVPNAAAESYAGLQWTGAGWFVVNGDGAGNLDSHAETVTDNVRHVLEVLIVSGTKVEYYLDGVLVYTSTEDLPTGDVDWTALLESDGTGGAGDDSFLTVVEPEFQEDLS